jgi:hypothetical protein
MSVEKPGEKCVKPKDVLMYILDEFITVVRSADPHVSSGLGKVVLPTLLAMKEIAEESKEEEVDWDSITTTVAMIVNAYIISVLYDNAPKTCLQTLISWLKESKGTVLEPYAKAVAQKLGIPI